MLYSSRNGCLFYYDSVLYSWKVAEPTTLFLMGLESITSYNKSVSDKLTISKYAYYEDRDTLEELNYISELYDEIYSFLSQIGSVNDYEQYLNFNCYGLKLLLNTMTGTGTDRTVPIIFKNDINNSLIDLSKVSVRVPESTANGMSYYDNQAQKIYDIFNDACYDLQHTADDGKTYPSDYIDATHATPDWMENKYDKSILECKVKLYKDIASYNKSLEEVHDERVANSGIYSLIDFEAMYSYALGVLFGCTCLGFDNKFVWRFNPRYWYNGEFRNLVTTAWYVFHFKWTNNIGYFAEHSSDTSVTNPNQFREIQENKLWNFDNDKEFENEVPVLADDEEKCYCLSVGLGKTPGNNYYFINDSEWIDYSKSTNVKHNPEYKGSYINVSNGVHEWDSIDNKVSQFDSSKKEVGEDRSADDAIFDYIYGVKGVISENDSPIVRYFGNNQIILYKAYSYIGDDDNIHYLAPKVPGVEPTLYYTHYIYTPTGIGWVRYDGTLIPNNLSEVHFDIGAWHGTVDSCNKYFLSLQPSSIINDYRFGFRFSVQGYDTSNGIIYDSTIRKPKNAFKYKDETHTELDLITFYECFLSDDSRATTESDEYTADLYGIWNGDFSNALSTLPSSFDRIIPGYRFDLEGWNKYPDGYSISEELFDLDQPLLVFANKSAGDANWWLWSVYPNSEDPQTRLAGYLGYSKSPSQIKTLYDNYETTDSSTPHEYEFRYFSYGVDDIYWCGGDNEHRHRYFTYQSTDPYEETGFYTNGYFWCSLYAISKIVSMYEDSHGGLQANTHLFSRTNKTLSLYMASIALPGYSNLPVYFNETDPTNAADCVYINAHELDHTIDDSFDFVEVSTAAPQFSTLYYSNGITHYPCEFVYDSETPVWYDSHTNLYWNGLHNINEWQQVCPALTNVEMYDATPSATVRRYYVYEDVANSLIIVNGASLSYADFYAGNYYGLIKETLQVFNPSVTGEGVIDCYHDTNSTYDRYIIPSHNDVWRSRADITALGYTFVDGTSSLYNGQSEVELVYDNDPID